MPQIAGMLNDIGREVLVILYAPSVDRTFSVLIRQADHIIEITPTVDVSETTMYRSYQVYRYRDAIPDMQQTLEVS